MIPWVKRKGDHSLLYYWNMSLHMLGFFSFSWISGKFVLLSTMSQYYLGNDNHLWQMVAQHQVKRWPYHYRFLLWGLFFSCFFFFCRELMHPLLSYSSFLWCDARRYLQEKESTPKQKSMVRAPVRQFQFCIVPHHNFLGSFCEHTVHSNGC